MPIQTVNDMPDWGPLQPDCLSNDAWQVYQLRRNGATQREIVAQTGIKLGRVQQCLAQARVRFIRHGRNVVGLRAEDA